MAILINDNSARVEYTATSGQTVFTVPFEFFANDDLNVYRNGTLITYDATPANANEYSVSGAGVTGGGSITLGAGATLNDTLLIVRDIAVERVSDFPTSGPFPIDSLNTDLDTIVAIEQQLETKIDQRTLHLSESDSPNSLDALPDQATRANKVLGFDADGNPTQSTNTLSQIDTAVSTTLSGTLPIARGGTGATTASGARSNLGLGSIATQSSSSVAITGGSVSGITDLAIADGGTGASNVTDARSNLGLGTAATQDADSIAITGGSVTGITDLAVADGGTGASSANAARSNLSAAQLGANSDITSMSGVTGGIASPDYIDFDTGALVSRATGRLWWDNADSIGSLNLGMAGSDVTMQLGQETFLRIKASAAITNGQVVMFTGTVGVSGGLTAAPASGLTKSTGTYVLGVATENIALNGWGYITNFGIVRGVNTAAFVDGDVLYLDPSVAGGLTTTIPAAPNPKVEVAAVIHAHASNGILFVRPHSFPEIANLADVDGPSATDTYLKWNGSNFVWSPVTGATGGTVTSVDVSGGTTGLSFSGGPITTTGTITASGTLGVANGGTGATSLSSGYLTKGNGTSAVTASVVYDDGTNVGIGTTSLGAKLQINSQDGFRFDVETGAASTMRFGSGFTGESTAALAYSRSTGAITFSQGNTGSALNERMRIDASGNVGIGTSLPRQNLDVNGNIDLSAGSTETRSIQVGEGRTGNGYSYVDLIGDATYSDYGFRIIRNNAGANTGSSLVHRGTGGLNITAADAGSIRLNTTNVERMRVDSSGSVGIGTSFPSYILDIEGSTANTSRINVLRTGGSGVGVQLLSTGNDGGVAATNSGPLNFYTSDIARMKIDSSGTMLVGKTVSDDTTAGTRIVSVGLVSIVRDDNVSLILNRNNSNGATAYFRRSGATVGSISVTTTSTAYNTSSDYRLKDIAGPIADSGAYIDALKPVQGSWKADGSRFIGLLAHEVQEVSETEIATGEKDGEEMQAMNYSAPELIANLIAEVQSLRARVAQLEGN